MSALTKIFIVLQLVCSLVLSVLLVLMVSKQGSYKTLYETEVTKSLSLQATHSRDTEERSTKEAAFTAMQTDLSRTKDDAARAAADNAVKISDLSSSLAQAKLTISQLTSANASLSNSNALAQNLVADMTKMLDDLRPKVGDLTSKNAQLSRQASDLKNALDSAEQAIRKLQEQVAQAEAAPKSGAAQGENAITAGIPSSAAINARVSKTTLSLGQTLIELPLGTRDGVQVGTRFAIFRDHTYVADAAVDRVSPDQAVAHVTITKPGQSVQVGDMVMTGQ